MIAAILTVESSEATAHPKSPQKVRERCRKVIEMMHKSGVQVAELHETANLLLRRRK
jgi:predicted nuclease with RNAse H fold